MTESALMTHIYEDVTLRLPRNVLIESLAAASGTQTLSEYVTAALQAANTPTTEQPAEPQTPAEDTAAPEEQAPAPLADDDVNTHEGEPGALHDAADTEPEPKETKK